MRSTRSFCTTGSCDVSLAAQESTGKELMNASVEIVFDNSDNRFPVGCRILFRTFWLALLSSCCSCRQIDETTVRIKRAIGHKKDDYWLNGKHVPYVPIFDF